MEMKTKTSPRGAQSCGIWTDLNKIQRILNIKDFLSPLFSKLVPLFAFKGNEFIVCWIFIALKE